MTASTTIDQTFAAARADGRLAFMPFITAGDPDVAMTARVISQLADAGVDLIEVGFPYSDPIADGPVIQASYTRALDRKTHVADILGGIRELQAQRDLPPLLAMVSYAIIFRYGVDAFIEAAADAGFAGFIVPDLPGDEAAECFEKVRSRGLDLIQLIAPTTPRERVREILKHCSGFVYCIAVAGTTGERENVAAGLLDQLAWLRQETDVPLAVGFGISKPQHVEPLRSLADGVIVGTAIVRHLQQLHDGEASTEEALAGICKLSEAMVAAVRSAE